MKSNSPSLLLLLAMLLGTWAPVALATEETNTNASAITNTSSANAVDAAELMTSFLHLQERVHATQLAVERSRADAEANAAKSAEALSERLKQIEDSVNTAHSRDLETFQKSFDALKDSNQLMIQLAVAFAVAGFLALGMTAWLQWRTVSRLSEISSTAASHPIALPAPQWMPALGAGMPIATNTQAAMASARLMEALSRLEKRISQFERHPAEADGERPAVASTFQADNGGASEARAGAALQPEPDEFAEMLREGEDLLAGEEAQRAIACFDRILAMNPTHAEALLRKGTACERLQDNQEAIRCYDAAIAADSQLTMAYLYKGGLFNRMERFSEAMECYEQALRVQEDHRSA